MKIIALDFLLKVDVCKLSAASPAMWQSGSDRAQSDFEGKISVLLPDGRNKKVFVRPSGHMKMLRVSLRS